MDVGVVAGTFFVYLYIFWHVWCFISLTAIQLTALTANITWNQSLKTELQHFLLPEHRAVHREMLVSISHLLSRGILLHTWTLTSCGYRKSCAVQYKYNEAKVKETRQARWSIHASPTATGTLSFISLLLRVCIQCHAFQNCDSFSL